MEEMWEVCEQLRGKWIHVAYRKLYGEERELICECQSQDVRCKRMEIMTA